MTPSMSRSVLAAVGAALLITAIPAGATPGKGKGHGPKPKKPVAAPCVDASDGTERLDITVNGQPTFGYYALPAKKPVGLVVFAHGYGHTAESWRAHAARTAKELNVVAVTMEYRGQTRTAPSKPGGLPGSRGWQVQEGAEDSVAAAQFLERTCKLAGSKIVIHGVSMGGNTAGLALAMKPKRSNGKPLFDHWVQVEGAANVIETYFEAQAVSQSGNAYAVGAVEDIEREMGGSFQDRRDVYAERTVNNRVGDIKASGVKSVAIVHGVGDGLVPYNQSVELNALLTQAGVPTLFTTVLTRTEESAAGTTADGYVTGYVPGAPTSPFAGHGSEVDEKQDVIRLGFENLTELFKTGPRCGAVVFDGADGAKSFFAQATC